MLLFENVRLAISGLLSNKMRALLTMLGIIIGIGSVIGIVTIGKSAANGFDAEMKKMGSNNISVYLQQKTSNQEQGFNYEESGEGQDENYFIPSIPEESDYMTDEMILDLKRDFKTRASSIYVSESIEASEARNVEKSGKIALLGTNIDYKRGNNLNILTGRYINKQDLNKKRNVCVISSLLGKDLFLKQDPIGETIDVKIANEIYNFYVVGVYEYKVSKGVFSIMGDTTTNVYIPITTAKYIKNAHSGYQELTIVPNSSNDVVSLSNDINSYFKKEYASNPYFEPTAINAQAELESTNKMLTMISLAISVIAGISLLVGGIGVMNIMLVSITERTREIGTRKALGATNDNIRFQFIVESIIICLLGGIIGIILGLTIGAIGSKLIGYKAVASISVILIAVGFSMLIGVFFGFYPANKAAKLNPIEALRYE